MTRIKGMIAVVVACGMALVLAACGGLPTSGPVEVGLEPGASADTPDFAFLPDRPQPGASPEEIVEGFIRAGSGPGVLGRWERAREFLASPFSETWRPENGVTVDVPGDRVYESDDEGAVTLSLVAVATVDDKGSYVRSEVGPTDLPFTLEQQDDGEWRITSAPDGIVLDRDIFPSVFHDYSVAYFDPSWQFLVPDVRWFPTANAATRVADALVNKPRSPWLDESVATAFPESVTMLASVPVLDGVAEIDLSEAALDADQVTLNRMQTQLEASLASVGVASVELTVSSSPIVAESVSTRSTRVPAAPLVLTEDEFGYLSGDSIESIPGLSQALVDASPTAIQVAPDRAYAAVTLEGDRVARIGADGSSFVLDERSGLVQPTIDPFGVVWTVPRSAPTAVRAYNLEGGPAVEIGDAWPEATEIVAMAASRDGTRMASIVTSGGRSVLWIAGIVRNTDGQPVRLGDPVAIGPVAGTGVGVAWLDDVTIGALSKDGEASMVSEQLVGGPAVVTPAAEGMTAIAGGATASSIRIRGEDGAVYAKRGTNWEQTATGVRVLATQQGTQQ